MKVHNPTHLHAIVETIYPGMVADWSAARRGKLKINDLDTVAARQTGMFREANYLSDSPRRDLVVEMCGNCVLHPTWSDDTIAANLSCAEPCNVWLSAAVQRLELAGTLA
jgi:hypothetical protein